MANEADTTVLLHAPAGRLAQVMQQGSQPHRCASVVIGKIDAQRSRGARVDPLRRINGPLDLVQREQAVPKHIEVVVAALSDTAHGGQRRNEQLQHTDLLGPLNRVRRMRRCEELEHLLPNPLAGDLFDARAALPHPLSRLLLQREAKLRRQPKSPQSPEGVVLQAGPRRRAYHSAREVRHAAGRVNHAVGASYVPGDGVDGEVPRPQVILDRGRSQFCEVKEAGRRARLNDDAGRRHLLVHHHQPVAPLVRVGPGQLDRIMPSQVPVPNLAAEGDVPHGSANQVERLPPRAREPRQLSACRLSQPSALNLRGKPGLH